MTLLGNFRNRGPIIKELGPFLGSASLAVLLFFGLSLFIGGISQKDKVFNSASRAQAELENAYRSFQSADFKAASAYFEKANANFSDINKVLENLSNTLTPLSNNSVGDGLRLARAGKSVSSAGLLFTRGLDSILNLAPELSKIIVLDKKTSVEPAATDIFGKLSNAFADFSWAKEFINIALLEVGNQEIASEIRKLQTGVSGLADFSSVIADLLKPQNTIVLVFQNNAEARPGGGFIGSYGRLRLGTKGVESLLIESIYEIDGRLREKISPPKPLTYIAGDTWAMRDSNWWPDFEVSAKKIAEFYEKEAGETPDAIISFTPDVLESIVGVLGEVPMPEYDVTLNQNNFYDVLQKQTSEDYDKVLNRPKKFMADLAAELFNRFPELNTEQKMKILGAVLRGVSQKNIMLYSRSPITQSKIRSLNLAGSLVDLSKHEKLDGLLVSNANVGGGKSDRHIGQKVNLTATIDRRGQIVHDLIIVRENRSPAGLQNPNNINYQRIYVPKGSRLLYASREVDIFHELGRTVFATTATLRPGESTELNIRYELPFTSTRSYGLLVESNPGQKIHNFRFNLVLPEGFKIIHNVGDPDISFIDSNKFLGFVFND